MANLVKASDETVSEITEALITCGLNNFIDASIIVNNNQKTDVIKIKKATSEFKFVTNCDIVIFVNESIYEQIPDLQRHLYLEERLTAVSFDVEKDRVDIKRENVKTFDGFLRKYDYDRYQRMKETIKSLYDKQKEDKAKGDIEE